MRPKDCRPITVCGAAATCEASCHRCGRTPRPSSATSRRDPIRLKQESPIAPRDDLWFAGEFREAWDHLERAFALFQPGRDDDLAFRFGYDAGVGVMVSLAIASWPLGEVDRAISLIDRMQTRMASLTHVGTLANGRIRVPIRSMRGDSARPTPNVFGLARLAREQVCLCGARSACFSRLGDRREGRWERARGHAPRRRAAARTECPVVRRALEDCAGRGGRSSGRSGPRRRHPRRGAGDVRSHRSLYIRGGASPRPRQHAAEARPRRPGARGRSSPDGHRSHEAARHAHFELRTALSLAKLYQSTGRLADALAVLAPTLEGFSPTPEMPEIAEAQALLVAIEPGAHLRRE